MPMQHMWTHAVVIVDLSLKTTALDNPRVKYIVHWKI